jgi:hypothetical protein
MGGGRSQDQVSGESMTPSRIEANQDLAFNFSFIKQLINLDS